VIKYDFFIKFELYNLYFEIIFGLIIEWKIIAIKYIEVGLERGELKVIDEIWV
jgi:hypothetical protein